MKVLMLSDGLVGDKMASPGIRCWELARALSRRHEVTIVAPLSRPETLPDSAVKVIPRQYGTIRKLAAEADVVVAQLVTPQVRRALRRRDARFVYDGYVPLAVEGFDWYRGSPRRVRAAHLNYFTALQNLGLSCADAVICASDRQREMWWGSLLALGAINVDSHDADPSLRGLVTVVPTGCPNDDPVRMGTGPRELYGLADDDVVLLWGGGVWNWFDPLTVLAAVEQLAAEGVPVRLVFMGLMCPDPLAPEFEMTRQLYDAAERSGLIGTHVFLNEGWIDYQQRQAWLLDADIGISAHGTRIESKYAFRTRVLDYLWSGLPVVATEGDALAELVAEEHLGATVRPGDVAGWVAALRELAEDPEIRATVAGRVRDVRERFRWDNVAVGLEEAMTAALARPARSAMGRRSRWHRIHCATALFRLKAVRGPRATVRSMWHNYVPALRRRLEARRRLAR